MLRDVQNLRRTCAIFKRDEKRADCSPKNANLAKKEKAHLQRTEIDKIDKNNIVSIKTYSENAEEESFNNMNEKINKLLINDKIFYKDNGIFLYFLLLSSLFLYFILILIINSS